MITIFRNDTRGCMHEVNRNTVNAILSFYRLKREHLSGVEVISIARESLTDRPHVYIRVYPFGFAHFSHPVTFNRGYYNYAFSLVCHGLIT